MSRRSTAVCGRYCEAIKIDDIRRQISRLFIGIAQIFVWPTNAPDISRVPQLAGECVNRALT
jgi:hypothetical protein